MKFWQWHGNKFYMQWWQYLWFSGNDEHFCLISHVDVKTNVLLFWRQTPWNIVDFELQLPIGFEFFFINEFYWDDTDTVTTLLLCTFNTYELLNIDSSSYFSSLDCFDLFYRKSCCWDRDMIAESIATILGKPSFANSAVFFLTLFKWPLTPPSFWTCLTF